MLMMVFAVGCTKSDEPNNEGNDSNGHSPIDTIEETSPSLAIIQVSDITHTSVKCSGLVVTNGGDDIVERGFCWSSNSIPLISDNHIVVELSNDSVFTSYLTGLESNTIYQIRAYAINSGGVGYSNPMFFTTHYCDGVDVPIGAICGVYSVSESKKVFFSKGNLQYRATSNTWRFAEKQYEVIGINNQNISSNYYGLIDLFGWGTSGRLNSFPYNTSSTSQYGGGLGHENDDIAGTNYDWGVYNRIWNGGDQEGLWRTLTNEEWNYLLEKRNTSSEIRYVHAQVNGVNGVVLLPDNWNAAVSVLNNSNPSGGGYGYMSNVVDAIVWQDVFEPAGAVFLPAAGYRDVFSVLYLGQVCEYWSSTHYSNQKAYYEDFRGYHQNWWDNETGYRHIGRSVRLVCPVE